MDMPPSAAPPSQFPVKRGREKRRLEKTAAHLHTAIKRRARMFLLSRKK